MSWTLEEEQFKVSFGNGMIGKKFTGDRCLRRSISKPRTIILNSSTSSQHAREERNLYLEFMLMEDPYVNMAQSKVALLVIFKNLYS